MKRFPLKNIIKLAVRKPVFAIGLVIVLAISYLLELPETGVLPKSDSGSDFGSGSASDEIGGLCKVNSVYDGDTMRLTCGSQKTKVRLFCIDTPEMEQRPWGRESRDYLRSIAPDYVSLQAYDKDRYGRIVAEVFDGEVNLNQSMVEQGQAAVYSRYCNKQTYFALQQKARDSNLGIWSKPGLHQEPWNWRKQKHASK